MPHEFFTTKQIDTVEWVTGGLKLWRAMFNKLDFNKTFFLSCSADNIFHESDRQKHEGKFYTCFTENESAERRVQIQKKKKILCSATFFSRYQKILLSPLYFASLQTNTSPLRTSHWLNNTQYMGYRPNVRSRWLWILTNFFLLYLYEPRQCEQFINSQKRTRTISSHRDQKKWVNKEFIMWISGNLFLPGHGRSFRASSRKINIHLLCHSNKLYQNVKLQSRSSMQRFMKQKNQRTIHFLWVEGAGGIWRSVI